MYLKFIFAGAAALFTSLTCPAQKGPAEKIDDSQKITLKVPRPALQKVQSLDVGKQVLDTIELDRSDVRIILYADNTWKYYKDPKAVLDSDVFAEYWNSDYPDPYRLPVDSIPQSVSLWVVDTLSDYRCPDITKVYSPFGNRHGHHHTGVDLPLHTGDPVYAAFSGKVRMSKYYHGYGNLVIIRHENGLETFYAHLSKRLVKVGDWVDAGTVIGLGGSTGRATGAHLHFETRYKGYAFDPQWIIDFESGDLRHRVFTLNRRYLSTSSRYVPESDDEEIAIAKGDSTDKAEAIAQADSAAKAKAAAEAAKAQYYTIRKGDSLYNIARSFHTSVTRICALNSGLTSRTTLKIGRRIRVK